MSRLKNYEPIGEASTVKLIEFRRDFHPPEVVRAIGWRTIRGWGFRPYGENNIDYYLSLEDVLEEFNAMASKVVKAGYTWQ